MNRRDLMVAGAVVGAAGSVTLTGTGARADNDAMGQAPAFQRITVGDTIVTALSDGHLPLNAGVFPEVSEEVFAEAMRAAFLSESGYNAPVNAYVIQRGDSTVLIDAGGTPGMAPTLGNLIPNLEAAGVAPSDINTVLISHMHPDHTGALMADGAPAFSDAEMILRAEEAAFWTDPATRERLPEQARPMFDGAKATVEAYGDQVTRIDSDREVAPGISAVFMPGHTPGHCGFRVSDGGSELLIWGDIIHVAPLQMPAPSRYIQFDTSPETALETRVRILDQASADRVLIAGMHMPFPGFGHIAKVGEGYEFVRSDWQYQL